MEYRRPAKDGAWYLWVRGYAKSRTLGVQSGELREESWEEEEVREIWEVGREGGRGGGGGRSDGDVDQGGLIGMMMRVDGLVVSLVSRWWDRLGGVWGMVR